MCSIAEVLNKCRDSAEVVVQVIFVQVQRFCRGAEVQHGVCGCASEQVQRFSEVQR
jgi:hypothetical protein